MQRSFLFLPIHGCALMVLLLISIKTPSFQQLLSKIPSSVILPGRGLSVYDFVICFTDYLAAAFDVVTNSLTAVSTSTPLPTC